MDNGQRIEKVEDFIHLQRYLHGLHFRVVPDPEKEDAFLIEFASATQRQLATLNHRLRLNEMSHIRCRAQKVIPFEKPRKNHKHHKK